MEEIKPVVPNTPPVQEGEVKKEEPIQEEKKPKSKVWLIIVLAVLFFVILLIVAIVFLIKPLFSDILTPTEVSKVFEEYEPDVQEDPSESNVGLIVVDLEDGRELVLYNVPTVFEDQGYELISDDEDRKAWMDNNEGYGSTSYLVTYYSDSSFGSDDLETVTVDGTTYEYLQKTDGIDADGAGTGVVWSTENIVNVNGYPAYEVISYYNPMIDDDTPSTGDFEGVDNSSGVKISCLFDLSKIFDDVDGYVEFGEISAFEGINTCEYFTTDFSMSVE
ncbi:MAG: hypothetical protein XD93_0397 [candidate division WS6 bacterium 34_10]|uniref:Uncharacterized protein n=1 Tax=candidate division WS6 bacterium 34_10 TaxID=1641389 RepID=A0A124FX94_9BACT|nr:MAG: hypothetical protein XD93_0397 [candidate division WS6 bacterium 34_10]